MKILSTKIGFIAAALFVSFAGGLTAQAQILGDCGDVFSNGEVGPYDYRNPDDQIRHIPIIEKHHFNSDVEYLVKGQSTANIMGDLDFVLRAVPNHQRALASLMRYAPKRMLQERRYFDTECYFRRAVTFRPDDAAAHVLYGVYLARNKKMSEAKTQYLIALKLQPDYAEAHYNLGLLYVDQRQYELAVESAVKAYDLGFPLPGLRRQLERAGAWTEE